MSEDDVPLLEYWYRALNEEFGVKVLIVEGSADQLRQKLYQERVRAKDPNLAKLSIVVNRHNPSEVWICHTDKLSGKDET